MKSWKKSWLTLCSLMMAGCGTVPLTGQMPLRGMNTPLNSMAASPPLHCGS